MILFETQRLSARRLIRSDAEAMAAIYGDVESMQFVGDGRPLTIENCLYWVEVTDGNFERRGYGMIALTSRSSGELLGCAGVVHPGQQPEAEVKYAFRKDTWGQGYATEAVTGLIAYARSTWGVGKLIATIHPGNTASRRVLSKVGFSHLADRTNDDGTITEVWHLPEAS